MWVAAPNLRRLFCKEIRHYFLREHLNMPDIQLKQACFEGVGKFHTPFRHLRDLKARDGVLQAGGGVIEMLDGGIGFVEGGFGFLHFGA